MNKKIVLLLTLLASITYAHADGFVSIENVRNAVPGYTGSFDIVLSTSNTETFQAYQLDVQLPEGFSFSGTATNFSDCYKQGALLTTHATTVSDQGNNTRRFSGNANPNASFTSTAGTLLTIYFTVDANASGDLTANLKNISFANTSNASVSSDDATGNITVGSVVTLSEDDTTAPIAISNVDVTVERTLKAGVWNTIVLPFDVPADQIATVFGEGTKIGEFTGYDYNTTTKEVKVNFEDKNQIVAHTPYIIKVPGELSQITVSNADITNPTNDLTVNKSVSDPTFGIEITKKMIGTYVPVTLDDNCLFLSENNFVFSKGKSKIKGFHAYFNLMQAKQTLARMRISFDETTGIKSVKAGDEDAKIFNLSGQRVAEPGRGLYIKNGKTIINKK